MLPGYVAGHYAREDLDIDLVWLARRAGAEFVQGAVEGLDARAKTVRVPGRPPVAYDVLSIDIGVHSGLTSIDGAREHLIPAKPLAEFASAWRRFVENKAVSPKRVVVIGGGVAGVELAMAAAHRVRTAGVQAPQITILEKSETMLANLPAGQRRRLLGALTRNGIRLVTGSTISRIHPNSIILADGASVEADFMLSAPGALPYDWVSTTELAQHDGYISVDPYLRSLSHEDVFAVGDCAHMMETPREKAGVFAIRQAPVLLNNLHAALFGRALRPFQPQRNYLKLVSTGDKSAVALKYGLSVEGDWLWRLKDRIDRRFMRTLRPPNTH